jgi:hypothetical protein
MSIRIQKNVWLVVGIVLAVALGLSILAASSSADSDAAPAALASDQFSVSNPADSAEIIRVTASSEAALRFVTGTALPGNLSPQPISEIGVASMPSGKEMAVTKIGQSMCVMHGADAGCGETPDVVVGRLFGARPTECGSYWVFGLVPDGVEQVQIDRGNDGTIDETLPVVDNVYEGVLKAESSTAVGVDSSGAQLFETELPLDYYAETNGACN